jgi:hypothetical protein
MRIAYALALSLAMLTPTAPTILAPAPAMADARVHGKPILPPKGPPPARTPSVLKGGDPGIARYDHDRRPRRPDRPAPRQSVIVVPQTVVVAPRHCWQPGYWTYQWVPQTHTYSAWVPGHWSADGYWIEGHLAPSQVSWGYYHPLWVEGYYTGC